MDLLRDTSWDAVRAFAEFAEDANFTRAAARLHLSQPALHTKIANLGATLGTPLYIRRGRRIEITEAGRKVQRFARQLGEAAEEFQADLQGQKSDRPVVLSAGEGSYLYILGDALRAYRAESKHLLRLETADRHASLTAILSASAHLGVATLETIPTGIVARPLTRVGQMLAVPSRHLLAKRRRVSLKDLNAAALIVPPADRPHRVMISQMLQSAGVDWQVAVEASGWELMLHFVRLGLGLAIVNACCRLPAGVVGVAIPELPSLQYHVFHLERPLPPQVVQLKNHLLAHADAWQKRTR